MDRSSVVQEVLNLFDQPRYLEIGVDTGDTFRFVSAAQKIAVDPQFKFELPPNSPDIRYYPITSDQYFATECPVTQKFHVVYIDGLHTFEQCLRDFMNALVHLEAAGVIIVDDILPVSYHSSLSSLDLAFRVRDHLAPGIEVARRDNTWMGSVYKLAFFVDAFAQQCSYATVQENHGQLILWIDPRSETALTDRPIRDLASLEFVDTIVQRDVFRIQPLANIVRAIRGARSRAPV